MNDEHCPELLHEIAIYNFLFGDGAAEALLHQRPELGIKGGLGLLRARNAKAARRAANARPPSIEASAIKDAQRGAGAELSNRP